MNGMWSEASRTVIAFAEDLIRNFHPHLEDARIAFVFRKEAQKMGSRIILGNTSKVPAQMQPHLEYDFLIWLSEEDYERMDDLQREALIDHQLCHCGLGSNGWTIRPHDIQEFSDVVQRHGIYSGDVARFRNAIDKYMQSGLPGSYEVAISGGGKVSTMTGAELSRAAQALGD